MKKNIFSKRILPILLTIVMLVGMVPFVGIASSAATYDVPTAGDKAWVGTGKYALTTGGVSDSVSSAPSNAYMAKDKDGVRHSIRSITLRSGYGDTPDYDPNLQLYCIEFGKGFASSNHYTGYSPSGHSYWKALSKTAREGIMLTMGLGYPASTIEDLGARGAGDAIAATQILVWEFETGRRTSYTGMSKETDLYDSCIKGSGAETPYWTILELANNYKSSSAYIFDDLEKNASFVLYSLNDAQTVLVYGKLEPLEHEKGTIAVHKVDENGKDLAGAQFAVYDSSNNFVINIGPTDNKGYAKVSRALEFDTYTVVETVAPAGHTKGGPWTVVLGPDNVDDTNTVTLTAENTSQKTSFTPAAKKLVNGQNPGNRTYNFVLTDASGYVLDRATNDAEGNVKFSTRTYDLRHLGTHTYIIKEEIPDTPDENTVYDEHEYKIEVTVAINANGNLTATKKDISGSGVFNNTQSCSYTPIVYKELVGRDLKEGEFEFALLQDGNEIQRATNNADGKVIFDTIEYTNVTPGQSFVYTVHEVIEDTDNGIKYDDHTYTVAVVIEQNANGSLSAKENASGSNKFVNDYSSTGSAEISVIKRFENGTLKGGEYEFELVAEDGSVVDTATNDANGNVDFKAIDFTLADVGTHNYTVREKSGTLPGVSYDGTVFPVVVTVADQGNGKLDVKIDYPNGNTFVNVYSSTGSAEISVIKRFENGNLKGGEYEFELVAEDGSVVDTATNDANGNVDFKAIDFTLADVGTHNYTVREKSGTLPGVSYDGTVFPVVVTVADQGNGKLDVKIDYPNGNTFVNVYSSTGSAEISVIKRFENGTLKGGEFEFELVDKSGSVVDTATNDANGNVDFKAIDLTLADVGTHNYTVREKSGTLPGVSYDGTVFPVVVTVADQGNGKLDVKIDYPNGNTFVNVYSAEGSAKIELEKDLIGADLTEGQFSFVLSENGKDLQTKSNAANGKIVFDDVEYTLADCGTHTYTIREINDGKPGYSYSTKVLTVEVSVSDAGDGTLKTEVSYPDGQKIENTYSAKGSFRASAWKQLIGKQLVAGMFNFELIDVDGNVLDKATNDATGLVTFGAVEYTLDDVGEHRYFIREIPGNAGGITYDETVIEIVVSVSDNKDGTLKVDVSYTEGQQIVNTYDASAEYTPAVQKVLTGTALLEGQFTFVLTDEDGNKLDEDTNDADGKVVFDTFHYDLEDMGKTYVYKIYEVNDGQPGYSYDEHVVTISVSISDAGDGTLDLDITYDGSLVFENHYGATGSWTPTLRKELNGKKLEAGQFTFELVGAITGEVISTATNDEYGVITFNAIEFNENYLGVHMYILREVNDGKPGYSYDEHTVEVSILVEDNGDGTLTVTPTYEGELVYQNTYSAEGSALIEIYKELVGKELEDGEFEFEIKNEAGEQLATATNDADGKVVFGMLTLDETMVGTHYFTINEIPGDMPGVTYTDKILSVEVTAVDNGDGTLTVDVSYPAGELLTNIYSAEGAGSVSILKQFQNGDLKGGEFEFDLLDEDGNVVGSAKNDANGRVQFGTMDFTLEDIGVYTYFVRERKGDMDHVIYTDKILRVVITVSDAGEGELSIDIAYPDGTTLVNVYDEPEVPQTGDHTLIYGGVALAALICGAALVFKKRKKIEE